jgi:D-alanine-D-alanine ligase
MIEKKLTVAVLMGGDSSERSVSFSSGRAVADALDPQKYLVTCFDVSSTGHRGDITRADAMGRKPRHAIFPVAWDHLVTALYTNGFDVVLPELHGGRGEDGTLQSLLDVAGIPYVGSGARACAIAIDKPLTKAYGREFGVQSPKGFFVESVEELSALEIPFPCVVKPAGGGSSVGVAILHESDQGKLQGAVIAALADGSGVLIEEFIEGAEVTCAVLGEGSEARALPVIEIVPVKGGGFYDFEAKYASGGSDHLIPPPSLDEATQVRVQQMALKMHRALGCRGVSRSDFIVTGDGEPYFLETNCVPGMTETSLVPDAARAAGISFPELIENLINGALGR